MTSQLLKFLRQARRRDCQRTLEQVEELASSSELRDSRELEALAKFCGATIPSGLKPIFERALGATAPVRRIALQKLAATAWYAGEIETAERYWRSAIEEGRGARDRLWHQALSNLCLILLTRGRHTEAFLLARAVLDLLPPGELGVRIFAQNFRYRALLELEPRLALAESRGVLAEYGVENDVLQPRFSALVSTEIDALLALSRWEEAQQRVEDLDRALPKDAPPAIRAGVDYKRMRARFEIQGARRSEVLETMERMRREDVGGLWDRVWTQELTLLRLRLALELGQEAVARTELDALLASCSDKFSSNVVDRLVQIVSEYQLPESYRAAVFEQAADIVLARVSTCLEEREQHVEGHVVPPDDWAILGRYQARLLSGSRELAFYFASRWRPGLEAYDRIVSEGLVVLCAWCGRVRAGEDWLPPADLGRLLVDRSVSHGICETCTTRAL